MSSFTYLGLALKLHLIACFFLTHVNHDAKGIFYSQTIKDMHVLHMDLEPVVHLVSYTTCLGFVMESAVTHPGKRRYNNDSE